MPPFTSEEADEWDVVLSNMTELLEQSRGDVGFWLEVRPVYVELQARLDDLARNAVQ